MKQQPFFLLFIGYLLCAQPLLFGWSHDVHVIIGNIADAHLNPEARETVREIMGKEKTLGSIATWADKVKQKHPRSRNLHYMNIPIQESDVDLEQYTDEPNIYVALKSYLKVLKYVNTTPQQEKEALKWIVHLVGDMHQPLHISDNGDKGGTQSSILFKNKSSNLHRLWDSELINFYHKNPKALQHEVMNSIRPILGLEHYGRGNINTWILESQALAKNCYLLDSNSQIPSDTLTDTLKITMDYATQNISVIKLQLKKASLRLAALLNNIFSEDVEDSHFEYIYSKNSKIFHKSTCKLSANIKSLNRKYSDIKPYDKNPHEVCMLPTLGPTPETNDNTISSRSGSGIEENKFLLLPDFFPTVEPPNLTSPQDANYNIPLMNIPYEQVTTDTLEVKDDSLSESEDDETKQTINLE